MIDFLVAALAAIRITRLLQIDDFAPIEQLRRFVLSRWPGKQTEFYDSEVTGDDTFGYRLNVSKRDAFLDHYETVTGADGNEVQLAKFVAVESHPLGELWECPRCLGYWISLFVVLGWLVGPRSWWWAVMLPLALSQLVIWGTTLDPKP